jgi:DNA-binding PadR family transcriptional regulator
MGEAFIGEFEHMVLLAVLRLGDGAYGVAIMDELERTAGRNSSRGATYMVLDRLETKGLLESHLGEPAAERGGRAKKFVTVTPEGLDAVRRSQTALRELGRGLEAMLEPGS